MAFTFFLKDCKKQKQKKKKTNLKPEYLLSYTLYKKFADAWPESKSVSHSVMSNSLQPGGLELARLLCSWNSPGKNTRVVAIPFFKGFSQPGDWTQVSCITGRFFTIWAIREAWLNRFKSVTKTDNKPTNQTRCIQ